MTFSPTENIVESSAGTFLDITATLVGGEIQDSFLGGQKYYPRSPLRYPGGKNRAIKSIYSIIPIKETKLCSPFLGGGSLELACTPTMKVHGSDIFQPLVTFWKVLLENSNQLADRVAQYLPIFTRTEFYALQKRFLHLDSDLETAAAFYVLNRSSFSGTTLSGGMSPDHPRFTESSIQRLRDFKVTNFEVRCADYRDVIPKHDDWFLYLDPPYKIDQQLYGINGNTHKGFDHGALAALLLKRERWIMSYNDCEEIRKLYPRHKILSVDWAYGMAADKTSNEILILSRDLTSDTISE